MDRKITKERVNIHLEYDWIKYVIIIAAAILMWWMIYSSANSIPNQFKLDIMCVDTPAVSEAMTDKVGADKREMFGAETVIEQINFSNQFSGATGNAEFSQIFPLRAITEDLLIAPRQWLERNPMMLDAILDFETIYNPYPTGKTDESGEEIVYDGYWTDAAGQAMLARLSDWGALYTYRFDRAAWEAYYTEVYGDGYEGEELAAKVKEVVDELQAAVDRKELEGKVLGIVLNRVPGLENGCFFNYAEEETGEGEEAVRVKREYVLSIFRPNLDKSSGGGNKGHFNGAKMDKERAEVFEFVRFLFDYESGDPARLRAQRYAAL